MAKTYQEKIDALEQQRLLALANRDAERYSQLCEELGVDAEVPELLEIAEAERLFRENPGILESRVQNYPATAVITPIEKKPRKNAADPAKYQRFLQDANRVYSANGNFSDNAGTKRRILMQHFPGRYSRQGMDEYDDAKLGKIFNNIVKTAKEVVTRPSAN